MKATIEFEGAKVTVEAETSEKLVDILSKLLEAHKPVPVQPITVPVYPYVPPYPWWGGVTTGSITIGPASTDGATGWSGVLMSTMEENDVVTCA